MTDLNPDAPPPITQIKPTKPRKKGYRFNKIKRTPGDDLVRRGVWLLDSEMDLLSRFGRGNAAEGIRFLCGIARQIEAQGKVEK